MIESLKPNSFYISNDIIRKIPVFYHVPKNSGTYVYISLKSNIMKMYKKNFFYNICEVTITDDTYIFFRIIIKDEKGFLNSCKKFKNTEHNSFKLHIKDLSRAILNNLEILSIIIEPRGFKNSENFCDTISKLLIKYELHKFIILRNPFLREQSLFHYLKSDNSKHELTHNALKANTFEEYLMSNQLPDSWLIRNFLNLEKNNNLRLTEEHYKKTCKILESFSVYDIKDTEKALKEIIFKCFGIENFNMENYKHYIDNHNSYSKIDFESLPKNVKKIFKHRTYWDEMIYKKFVNEY